MICDDKTGTLTQNRISVHGLWIGGALMPRTDLATRTTVFADHRELFVNAALCHNRKEVGERLHLMSPTQLQLALDAPEILVARVAAQQKMRIVEALKQKGAIAAVTGDGVNDAPALKAAHSGMAEAAADVILLDDNFANIVAAIEEGLAVFDNMREFLTYILSSYVPQIVPYLAFVLFRMPLPLTIIQILAADRCTDMLPALPLGAEKPDAAVMQRPSRARGERLLSWRLVARAYLFLGVLEAVAAMTVSFVLDAAGWHRGQALDHTDPLYLQVPSACLATIVVLQMINVILCRHPLRSSLAGGLGSNRMLQLGIASELAVILFIAHTPAGNWLFGTAPIDSAPWLLAVACALLMCLLEDLRKALLPRANTKD